ncbi:hypothetical protein D3C86_1915980 [compost metagenome]
MIGEDRLGTAGDLELLVDAGERISDRLPAKVEMLRDPHVFPSLGKQGEDLVLTRGEALDKGGARRGVGDAGGQQGLAAALECLVDDLVE